MAFWGVEIKPGKSHAHQFDEAHGRLHVSQATLGFGSANKKSVLQCNIGSKSPVLLCSLLPEKVESCALNLEFEEEEEVVFSVVGLRSVHLTGFYLGQGPECGHDVGDESDSDGEDIAETETDQSDDYDSEGDVDEYEDDFIDDDVMGMFSPSPRPNSGVVIEEILDDEKPVKCNGTSNRPKKKKQMNNSDGNAASQKQLVVKGTSDPILESEDEDGFPISTLPKSHDPSKTVVSKEKSDKIVDEEIEKDENNAQKASNLKRKSETLGEDVDQDGGANQRGAPVVPSAEVSAEKDGKLKMKKKQKAKGGKTHEAEVDTSINRTEEKVTDGNKGGKENNDKALEEAEIDDMPIDSKDPLGIEMESASADKHSEPKRKKDKKKKKKKKKTGEIVTNREEEPGQLANGEKDLEVQGGKVQPSKTRTYANGLVVEELSMGKPDGKRASPGNRVSVRYIGKLKKNGEIFDSNISGKAFKFRLGIGQVIKGWDVGVEGMRIGDKRRLTIPPSMGYGAKGIGKIPGNAWLVFEVELVDVQ